MPYTVTPLTWDSAHFGYPCAKAVLTGVLTAQESDAFFEETKAFRFVTVNNPDSFPENNDILSCHPDILQADTNILLVNRGPVLLPDSNTVSHDICISDKVSLPDEVRDMVKHAFIHSRFYADSHIDAEKASGVFESWVKNAQNKEGKYFCICTIENTPAGFVLFHTEQNTDAVIELVCVSGIHREKGVGTAMLQAFGSFCKNRGLQNLYVGTQKRNKAALAAYRKNLYQEENVTHIFHMWNK